jgi:hypothetical protein
MFDEDFVAAIESSPTYSRTAQELEQFKNRGKMLQTISE